MLHTTILVLPTMLIFIYFPDAIASADNVRIAPSLKSQKGLYIVNHHEIL